MLTKIISSKTLVNVHLRLQISHVHPRCSPASSSQLLRKTNLPLRSPKTQSYSTFGKIASLPTEMSRPISDDHPNFLSKVGALLVFSFVHPSPFQFCLSNATPRRRKPLATTPAPRTQAPLGRGPGLSADIFTTLTQGGRGANSLAPAQHCRRAKLPLWHPLP